MYVAWLIFLCWGSFLNSASYRLIYQTPFFDPKSRCPHCNSPIAWYDLIPVISWILLKARCRTCTQSISWLYPFIELLTACACTALLYKTFGHYVPAYVLFFSALIVTIRTDLETMLISRFVTLYAIPFVFLAAYMQWLPIAVTQSIIGAATGYLFLWLVAHIFYKLTGKVGMGEGDAELLAFIGAATGFIGWWIAILLGSLFGSVIGISIVLYKKQTSLKLPFGPFLAGGALMFVLFKAQILKIFLL